MAGYKLLSQKKNNLFSQGKKIFRNKKSAAK